MKFTRDLLPNNLLLRSVSSSHPHIGSKFRSKVPTLMWYPLAPYSRAKRYTQLGGYCWFYKLLVRRCIQFFKSILLERRAILIGPSSTFLKHWAHPQFPKEMHNSFHLAHDFSLYIWQFNVSLAKAYEIKSEEKSPEESSGLIPFPKRVDTYTVMGIIIFETFSFF